MIETGRGAEATFFFYLSHILDYLKVIKKSKPQLIKKSACKQPKIYLKSIKQKNKQNPSQNIT